MGNCTCLSSQNNQASNTSNQKYKLLIIGPTFSGKTTFLKALQILYSNGFDEVSNEIYKDIMIRQIIFCVRTIVEHITSDDEKMEDEISYHSQITRDHSHLSVEDVTNTHHLSYSGGSIGLSSRSHLARQNSKSTKAAINMKKFHNPEIAKAAEFFLQTKFSQSSSYFEWLSNKKFIDNLNVLWNDKQIQSVFSQNYYSTTKLPHSTKFFIDSILTKLTAIHNGLGNDSNYGGSSTKSGAAGDSGGYNDDEKYNSNNSHRKEHSRTTSSLGRFKGDSQAEINMENLDHPKGIDSMISVPMLSSQSQSGIVSGGDGNDNDGKNDDNNGSSHKHKSDSRGKSSTSSRNGKDNENDSNSLNNTISLRYRPSNKEILLCYHRTINRNKEKINLQNKLAFEIWDVGGSKSEMKKWILYCQRTNIVVFMVSLFQVSMLKYTLQLWESIINTKYETWFGTQRAMNELILMASESSRNNGNAGANGNGGGSNGNDGNGGNNSRGGNSGRSGYTHMYGQSQNGNNNELAKLHSQSRNGGPEALNNGSVTTGTDAQGNANPNGNGATTIDIARIPCVLLLNGRERLADMISKDNINVKANGSSRQFFNSFNGDPKSVEAIVNFVQDTFMKSLKKKESRIQVQPMVVDCIDVESVKKVFADIQELCVTASQRGR